jgi:hypothetical protein
MAYSYQDYGGYYPRFSAQPQPQPMPQAQPMAQPMAQPQPPQNNGIIWIQGIEGAKSYLVAPNTTVQLWDSEAQVIYLKSADASGMPSMKILDYTIREQGKTHSQATPIQNADYVTREELEAFKGEISEKLKEVTGA